MRTRTKSLVAKFGASLPVLCAVHCAAMPLIITFLPLFGLEFIASENFEWLMIGFSILIALFLLGKAAVKKHKNYQPLLWAGLGFAIMMLGHVFHEIEGIFSVIGAGFVIYAYWKNWKISHQKHQCECEH